MSLNVAVFVTVLRSHYLLTGHFVGRRKQQQLQNWLQETVVELLKVYVMWRETPIRSSVLISLYNSNCCQPADALLTSLQRDEITFLQIPHVPCLFDLADITNYSVSNILTTKQQNVGRIYCSYLKLFKHLLFLKVVATLPY